MGIGFGGCMIPDVGGVWGIRNDIRRIACYRD